MWSTFLNTYIPLLIGAAITLVTAILVSNNTHKHELEDKKKERAIAAREIRLKEGEEGVKRIIFDFTKKADWVTEALGIKTEEDMKRAEVKFNQVHQNLVEEFGQGNEDFINYYSIQSLGDENLSAAWKNVIESHNSHTTFSSKVLITAGKGLLSLATERNNLESEHAAIAKRFFTSIREFFTCVNNFRSQ